MRRPGVEYGKRTTTYAKTGVKTAIDRWKKDGGREGQDYDHIFGPPERAHEEIHASTRDRKSRKS